MMTKIESIRRWALVLRPSDGGLRKRSSVRYSNVIFRCLLKTTRTGADIGRGDSGGGQLTHDLLFFYEISLVGFGRRAVGLYGCKLIISGPSKQAESLLSNCRSASDRGRACLRFAERDELWRRFKTLAGRH